MHQTLTRLLKERKIVKYYWALLNGTPDPAEGKKTQLGFLKFMIN